MNRRKARYGLELAVEPIVTSARKKIARWHKLQAAIDRRRFRIINNLDATGTTATSEEEYEDLQGR
jgi:hypothetical protein